MSANEQCWFPEALKFKLDAGAERKWKSMNDGQQCPKSSREMSIDDRWYFEHLENGTFEKLLQEANQGYGAFVQANPFAA